MSEWVGQYGDMDVLVCVCFFFIVMSIFVVCLGLPLAQAHGLFYLIFGVLVSSQTNGHL